MIVINIDMDVLSDDENDCGNDESTDSISLAKRLIIRPMGVVSKKAIGAWKTPDRIKLCNFLLAA